MKDKMESKIPRTGKQLAFSREDYWPFILSACIVGSIVLTIIGKNLDYPKNTSLGQKFALAILYFGLFAYGFTKELVFRIERFIKAIIYLFVLSLFIGLLKGHLSFLIIVPGGVVGSTILYVCGWLGVRLANLLGYQDWIRPRVTSIIEKETKQEEIEKQFHEITIRSFEAWKTNAYRDLSNDFAVITEKYKTDEKFYEVCRKELNTYIPLFEILRYAPFSKDEVFISILDNIVLTSKRFILLKKKFLSAEIKRVIGLNEIAEYETNMETSTITINLISKERIEWKCLRWPKRDVVEKLIKHQSKVSTVT